MAQAFETTLTAFRIACRLIMSIVAIAILLGMFSRQSAPSVGAEAPGLQPVVVKTDGEDVRVIASLDEKQRFPHVIFQTSSGQELFSINYFDNKNLEILYRTNITIRTLLNLCGEYTFHFSAQGPRTDTVVKVRADGSSDVVVGDPAEAPAKLTRLMKSENLSTTGHPAPGVQP